VGLNYHLRVGFAHLFMLSHRLLVAYLKNYPQRNNPPTGNNLSVCIDLLRNSIRRFWFLRVQFLRYVTHSYTSIVLIRKNFRNKNRIVNRSMHLANVEAKYLPSISQFLLLFLSPRTTKRKWSDYVKTDILTVEEFFCRSGLSFFAKAIYKKLKGQLPERTFLPFFVSYW